MLRYGKKQFLYREHYFFRGNYLHELLKFDEIATSDRNLMIFGPKSIILSLYHILNNVTLTTRFLNVKNIKQPHLNGEERFQLIQECYRAPKSIKTNSKKRSVVQPRRFMEIITESTLEAQSMVGIGRIDPPGIRYPESSVTQQAAQKPFFRLFEFRIRLDLSS